MPSIEALEALTGRILAQEGKPPDQKVTFHMTPFVPIEGMEGVNVRFLIIGPLGPTEMLRPGVYVETNISPAQFKASPDGIIGAIRIIGAIAKHIAAEFAEPKQEPRTAKQIRADRENRRSLAMACRFPSSYSPLGFLMFRVVADETSEN